jgi:photosystem II stability/assembly factor-like uncharacterized protein
MKGKKIPPILLGVIVIVGVLGIQSFRPNTQSEKHSENSLSLASGTRWFWPWKWKKKTSEVAPKAKPTPPELKPKPASPPKPPQSSASPYPKSNNPDIIYGSIPPLECKPRNGHEYYRTDNTFVIDPKNPQIMYVSVEHKGFYKSTDGGKTWAPKTKGIKTYPKKDDTTKPCHGEYPIAVIDPQNSEHLILGLSGPPTVYQKGFWGETGGLVESWDGAETWQPLLKDWMNRYVTGIIIDPTDPKTIYYGTTAEPASWTEADPNKIFVTKGLIYKTTDGGKNWEELPTGFFYRTTATALYLDPKNNKNILAFTFTSHKGDGGRETTDVKQFGVLRSFDAGATWISTHPLPQGYDAIQWSAASPHSSLYFFVSPWDSPGQPLRSYYSVDGGDTFQPSDNYIHIAEYDPHDVSSRHMLGYKRIDYLRPDEPKTLFESNDSGATWRPYGSMPGEIIEQQTNSSYLNIISNITWDPIDKDTVYMTGAGGYIWKSTDAGKSWGAILSYDKLPE